MHNLAMVRLIRKHRDVAHTLERAFEREDLAIRDSEPLLHRALADIRDPRRAASPSEMQRSRIPLSSPMSECILCIMYALYLHCEFARARTHNPGDTI